MVGAGSIALMVTTRGPSGSKTPGPLFFPLNCASASSSINSDSGAPTSRGEHLEESSQQVQLLYDAACTRRSSPFKMYP